MPGWFNAARVRASRSKSLQPVRIARERVGQDFQRHVAIELRVAGAKDLSHTAFANRGDDFVDAEAGTGCERQRPRL